VGRGTHPVSRRHTRRRVYQERGRHRTPPLPLALTRTLLILITLILTLTLTLALEPNQVRGQHPAHLRADRRRPLWRLWILLPLRLPDHNLLQRALLRLLLALLIARVVVLLEYYTHNSLLTSFASHCVRTTDF